LRSSTDTTRLNGIGLGVVSPALLLFLVAQARESRAMVTVPRAGEGWQPLCAIYRRAFADAAETAVRARRYKIDALFDESLIRPVGEEDLRRAGFSPEVFRNLNTPEELADAGNS